MDGSGSWPCMLYNSTGRGLDGGCGRNGEPEALRFPMFLYDIMLQQDGCNPANDVGRIKVIISEGFPRGSHTMPIERVKNIVAFSFQHAPLGEFAMDSNLPIFSRLSCLL